MMRRTTAVVVALASLAAGCGGDDDGGSAGAPTDETTDTTDTTVNADAESGGDSDADRAAEPDESNDPDDAAGGDADDDADGDDAGDDEADDGVVPGDESSGRPDIELPADEPTELIVTDLLEGTGDELEAGDTIVAHYVGVLTADGTQFDESYATGEPVSFTVGVGQIIPGWDEGLIGVKAGGRRQLDIPADLAYGEAGAGNGLIPPNAALTFIIDVEEVVKPPPPPTLAPQADPADCPAPDGSSEQRQEFDEYPPTCIDVTQTYTAEVVTNHGTFEVELDPEQAPVTVNSFVVLARYHYFDGTECHRAIPGFVVQCGDPTATGSGGPGYTFGDELPDAGEYQVGSLAMANSGANTNGSQFFVITGENGAGLPPQYSLFGQVSGGLDDTLPALDALGNDDPASNGVPPLETITIESVTITES